MGSAHGVETSMRISALGESIQNGSVLSLGLHTGTDYFYMGLSLNRIHSSTVIQRYNRTTIYPIYLTAGIKAPWKLAPYFEAGVDLPEAIIDDLLDNENNGGGAQADYYYSGGLVYSTTDSLSFSLYAKRYNFIFREDIYAPTFKTRPHGYGIGVSIRY